MRNKRILYYLSIFTLLFLFIQPLIIWHNKTSFTRTNYDEDDDLYSELKVSELKNNYEGNYHTATADNHDEEFGNDHQVPSPSEEWDGRGNDIVDDVQLAEENNEEVEAKENNIVNNIINIINSNNNNVDDVNEKLDEGENKLTVVITTYKQPICLERMIALMKDCPIVQEIRVNWFEENDPILYGEYRSNYDTTTTNTTTPVIFDKYPNKISYRFHPRNFATEAIFSVDVDSYYSCKTIGFAFDLWKKNQNSAVGFHARFLRKKGMYAATVSYLKEKYFRHNTVFITKGGIVHRDKYELFFDDKYKHLREKVDENFTGEDILMSFVLEITKTKVIFACPEVHSNCYVFCTQNQVRPLGKRTSIARGELLTMFFDDFGRPNVFRKTFQGAGSIAWESGTPEGECMSNERNEWQNTPPCERFCSDNLICPSNVI